MSLQRGLDLWEGCSDLRGRSKVSPYITPPSRPSVHTCGLLLNEGRSHPCIEGILEAHAPGSVTLNHSYCVRVSLVEGLKCFRSVHIVCGDPFIVFVAITLPLHQILEPPSEVASIENLLDFILFFAFNHYWRRRAGCWRPEKGFLGAGVSLTTGNTGCKRRIWWGSFSRYEAGPTFSLTSKGL